MKKAYLAFLLSLCVACCMLLAGCGGEEVEKTDVDASEYQAIYDNYQSSVDEYLASGKEELQKLLDNSARRNELSKENNYWQAEILHAKDDANSALDELGNTDNNADAKNEWKDKVASSYDKAYNELQDFYIDCNNQTRASIKL